MKKRCVVLLLGVSLFLLIVNSALALEITKPAFGVSSTTTFDIEITTSAELTCKYSSPFQKSFDEMMLFTNTGSTTHNITDFPVPAADTPYDFFIDCGDGTDTAQLTLTADTSDPIITTKLADPAIIVQTPLQTKLKVTTDEDTICKYDEEAEDYDSMANFFYENSDASNEESYKTEHEATLTDLTDESDYNYKIKCKNLAGRLTGTTIRFNVNTKAEPLIINLTPPDNSYHATESVLLSITTNKDSVCKFGNSSDNITRQDSSFNAHTTEHETPLTLEPGTHTYHFRCIFEGPRELTTHTSFTIDNTPPEMVLVNDSQDIDNLDEQHTYMTDRLKIKFEARDRESRIKAYNYTIISGNEVIKNLTTTTDNSFTVRNLDLEDGRKYVFRVKAQNKVGLWSEFLDSDGVTVDISLDIGALCRNNLKDSHETDVDCGGDCSEKCSLGKTCNADADCSSAYCFSGVCSSESCDDGTLNQDETDVDCGGSCNKCLEGDRCTVNSDCSTGICTENICLAPRPCFNGVRDEFETDVDCGGVCTDTADKKCTQGQGCDEDSDCISNTCGIDGRCAVISDHDYDTVVSSEDNCPKLANPDQSDSDGDGEGDACDQDNDNDGMSDEFEKRYNFDPFDPTDADIDSDNDGLSNLREFNLETNPHNVDTDGDRHNDGKEVERRSDPKNSESKPGRSSIVKIFLWLIVLFAILAVLGFFYYRKFSSSINKTKVDLEYRKQELSHPETPLQPQQPPPAVHPSRIRSHTPPPEEIRKYRPKQLYNPIPPPPRKHTKGDLDTLREEHTNLSGEEIFDRLRKHTRKGRR